MDTPCLAVAAVLCLLLGCASGRPERLSADQRAPPAAEASGGRALAPPEVGGQADDEASSLQRLLSRLRLRTSGQTPAHTSLLLPRRDQGEGGALERLHIRTSGQTPADTTLLPRRDAHKNGTKESHTETGTQSRRSGPAHVSLVQGGQASPAEASRQTPASVGLLRPGGPAPPAAPQQDGVSREESSSFKQVNGESVRVVMGNYGYDSPEGLPVSFKYTSDENGNQASFTIGAGSGSGGSKPGGAAKGSGGSFAKGPAAGGAKGGAAGGSGGDKYLPPK